jgi:hypothetical protein
MNTVYKDILIKIFSYLSAKDIISCSQVNHKFYEVSSNNPLWFDLVKIEGNKYLKNPNSLRYDDKINYKLYYLSLFNQKYHLQIFNFYRDIRDVIIDRRNYIQKILVYSIYVPFAILFFPLFLGVEIYECISHQRTKYEYCSCDSCHKKLSMKVRSKYNI